MAHQQTVMANQQTVMAHQQTVMAHQYEADYGHHRQSNQICTLAHMRAHTRTHAHTNARAWQEISERKKALQAGLEKNALRNMRD